MSEKGFFSTYIMGEGEKRKLPAGISKFVSWTAVLTTLYMMWSVFGYPELMFHRGLSVGIFFGLTFIIYTLPGSKAKDYVPWYDWVLSALSVAVAVYLALNLDRLITRYPFADVVTAGDMFFGIVTIILMLEGSRRIIGPWLPILSLVFLAYALFGNYIPGMFGHNGFTAEAIVDELFLTTDGIFGSALGIASTYIIMFIIFGAFLTNSGAGDFLFDFASSIAGGTRGGLAKVGIIASGLFGMINGSPVANVSSMGVITIPMMKKVGYQNEFAAAVECAASTGGTIMPPVMGSVAFIMAEVIGVSYIEVAAAAALPAILYYAAILFAIDFRAGKLGMKGLPKEEIPSLIKTVIQGSVFFIPLIYLVVRLLNGLSPSRVGFETTLIILAVSSLRKETRMNLPKIFKALKEGTTGGILVVVTMAASGIIIGIINLTGIGTKFSSFLMSMAGQSTIITLIFTMFLAILLGLAMNITPAYLLTAVVAGPVLQGLGIPAMAAHMFILYYAAMATMTPPVASAAFAAAGIAEADPMRTGFVAMRVAAVAYLMPFVFIYQQGLLLAAPLWQIILSLASGLLASSLIAMGAEGWFKKDLTKWQRLVLLAAGLIALPGNVLATALALVMAVFGLGLKNLKFWDKKDLAV
ncbi:MAG: TRAP transporter fused permease subunit [Peptococcaceae bacterium]|nr:TRAP transporter fused permease subunit [Peptococcaceae bacterium]